MNLTGIWRGFYEFGQGYMPPHFGERVKVVVNIQENVNGFEGECMEEKSEFSIDEVSSIKGFLEDGIVSFINSYSNFYFFNKNNEMEVIKGKEMQIEYYGNYDDKSQKLFGMWEIEFEDSEQNGEIVLAVCSGIWILERE